MVTEMRNDFVVHQNDRTTYELITGHRFPIVVAVSGEEVMFLEVHKKRGANKWQEYLREGVYIGVQGRTAENIFGTEQGIVKAITVRRLPVGKTRGAELVTEVQAGVAFYISGEDEEDTAGIVVRVLGWRLAATRGERVQAAQSEIARKRLLGTRL